MSPDISLGPVRVEITITTEDGVEHRFVIGSTYELELNVDRGIEMLAVDDRIDPIITAENPTFGLTARRIRRDDDGRFWTYEQVAPQTTTGPRSS